MIIIIAEALFWVLVVAGMVVRYWLRMPTLSKFLLLAVPLVDIALVIAVIAELRAGRPVGLEHQLAGLYLGISLILGPGIIRWCDEKARSLSSREKSSPTPYATFSEKMRHELVFLAKWSVAVGIAFLINQGLMYAAVHESQREALSQASSMPLGSILVVAFFGPGWLLLFGDNDKQQKKDVSQ